MIFRTLHEWLSRKWQPQRQQQEILQAYLLTFSTAEGRLVLQHLIDQVYASVCPTNNAIDLALHNGRRSLLHEMLVNIDLAEHPDKYVIATHTEINHGPTNSKSANSASSAVLDYE